MPQVNFFTPIAYPQDKTFLQKCAEKADKFLYFGNKKVVVLAGVVVNNKQVVAIEPNAIKYSKKEIIFKIIALPVLGIPALLFKAGYRLTHHFEIITTQPAPTPMATTSTPTATTPPPPSIATPFQSSTNPLSKDSAPIVDSTDQEVSASDVESTPIVPDPITPTEIPAPPSNRVIESQKRLQSLLKEVNEYAQPIVAGFGEYVVFHSKGDQRTPVTFETYEKVHAIFCEHLPHLTKNSVIEEGEQRYHFLRAKVQEVDPSLELTFIPRTLYELTYLDQCIFEDFLQKKVCPRIEYLYQMDRLKTMEANDEIDTKDAADCLKIFSSKMIGSRPEKMCWHLTYFLNSTGDVQNEHVKEIAFRLNNAFSGVLPHSNPLTYTEIQGMTKNILRSFKKLSPDSTSNEHTIAKKISDSSLVWNVDFVTPTGSFSLNKEDLPKRVASKFFSLAITKNGVEGQIIQNCVAAECSRLAHNHFLLYRGGDLINDKIRLPSGEPHSLSFGTSPFAGGVYDAGAAAFHFMRIKDRNAFIVPIPFTQAEKGLYYFPRSHAVCQLTSKGLFFHVRSKAPAGLEPSRKIYGIEGHFQSYGELPSEFKSGLTESELEEQFELTMDQAISLN